MAESMPCSDSGLEGSEVAGGGEGGDALDHDVGGLGDVWPGWARVLAVDLFLVGDVVSFEGGDEASACFGGWAESGDGRWKAGEEEGEGGVESEEV